MNAAQLLHKLEHLQHTETLENLRVSPASSGAFIDLYHIKKENCGFGCMITEDNKKNLPIQIILDKDLL